MNRETVLMLEDDLLLLESNAAGLEANGYRVLACPNVRAARKALADESPDVLVLDVQLPDGNGFEFYEEYKEKYGGGTPVIFLTVMERADYIARGYDIGGLDYIIKPYKVEHLAKKIRSLLGGFKAAAEAIVLGNLRLDSISGIAFWDGKDLLLTPKEYAVLEYLARNRNRYVTAKELYEKVWGMDAAAGERTARVHVRDIRKKLGRNAAVDIESKWGNGYRFIRNGEGSMGG
jgi:DNA-binding response OmpR family regulator